MAYDVFVSYAQRDNTAAEGEPFVSRLLKFIGTECGKKYGKDVTVFDKGVIASGTLWQKRTYDELECCRVFLPIVSPSWVASNWAGGQWDAVSQRVTKDLNLGRQTRIVPIAYLLNGEQELPEKVRSLELKFFFDEVMDNFKFRMQVDLLAKEITDLLKQLDRIESQKQAVATDAIDQERSEVTVPSQDAITITPVNPNVIAAVTIDQKMSEVTVHDEDAATKTTVGPNVVAAGAIDKKISEEHRISDQSPIKAKVFLGLAVSMEAKRSRNRIKSELADRGYGIREMGETDETWTAHQLISEIQSRVDGCAVAIHFLEENAGCVLAGDHRPVVQIQCDMAREWESKTSNLFWIGQVSETKLKNYPAFILQLKYNNDPIAAFVSSLLNRLRVQERRTEKTSRQELFAQPIIWVICEKGDLDVAPDIVQFFADKGWVAFVPGFNFREIPYSQIFESENYFLFYWGKGDRDWCQINYEELVDARRVSGGFRPPRAALVYNGQARLDYKERFQWSFLKASEYDRFNPGAPKVQEFVARVASTFNSGLYADSTA